MKKILLLAALVSVLSAYFPSSAVWASQAGAGHEAESTIAAKNGNDVIDIYEEKVGNHEQKLEELMRQGGAYEEELAESSLELGNLYLSAGEAEEAAKYFEKALHVTKINHGLASELQIPILKGLIQSYIRLGDWETADSRQRNLHVVESEIHGTSCEIVPALEKLARWNIDLFGSKYGRDPGDYLYESIALYRQALGIVIADCSENKEAAISRVSSRLLGAYYILSLDEGKINFLRRWELRRKGEAVIEETLDYYSENSEPGSPYLGEAIVRLADWHLLFGNEAIVNGLYEEALLELKRSNVGEEALQGIFDPSRSIPEFFSLEFRNPLSVNDYESPVAVSYQRERYGDVSHITVEQTVPEDISRSMREYLGDARFRPAISTQGNLVLTTSVTTTYHPASN